MISNEVMGALTTLALAFAGLLLQYVKGKDTDKHGDSFLNILKGTGDSFNKIAAVLPQTAPYVKEYNDMVAEADKIWNASGFTAEDMKFLEMKAAFYKMQIDQAVARYRALKASATEQQNPA